MSFEQKKKKIEKKIVYNNTEKLYNTLLTIYFNQYNNIADKEHMDKKYDPENLFLQGQRFMESKKENNKSQPEETINEIKKKKTKSRHVSVTK